MQALDQRWQRNENFVYRKIESETILVPIRDNVGDMSCIYNLNKVGAFVWERLDGNRTLSEVIDLIIAEFVDELQEIDAIHL